MNRVSFVRSLLLLTVLLVAAGCKTETRQESRHGSAHKAGILAESRKLAVVSPSYLALEQDLTRPQGMHDPLIVIAKSGDGSAYIERVDKDFRVVHNDRSGKTYRMVGDLTISTDGSRVAYVAYIDETRKCIIADGKKGPVSDDIGMPQFSPDGKHLLYTIRQGKEDRLVIDHKEYNEYWVSQDVMVSPDSRYIAFAAIPAGGGGMQFVVSDFTLKDKKIFEPCGESFVVSDDRSRIAVVCSEEGSRTIKILDITSRALISTLQTPAAGEIVRKRFATDNRSFVYTTMTDDYQRFLHYNGRVERIPKGDEILSDPLVLTGPARIGVIIGTAFNARFYTAFHKKKQGEKKYGYISDFTASPDGRHHAYIAIKAGGEERMRIVVDGNEGPLFDKIVSPIFSSDGRLLAYRARQDGRRFLVISDLNGAVLRRHDEHDMVFQPIFIADGASVAYGVLDGNELWWKVEKL